MSEDRMVRQRAFWRGEGPCLLLTPHEPQALYDLSGYRLRLDSPRLMWEFEMRRAEGVAAWPTDGLPTVRPNLGVVFVPSLAGQGFQLTDGAMPWPGPPLSRAAVRAAHGLAFEQASLMRRAEAFFAEHARAKCAGVFAYLPDTQGVFDIAHMLNGDATFYELADPDERPWIDELLEVSLDLYLRASEHLKRCLAEPACEMVHGHGTSQGLAFPGAGVRLSEDTAVLLSPDMIRDVLAPFMQRAAEAFGGAFVHFCGRHEALFSLLCDLPFVRAIDLGNPELYDVRWLLRRCAETGTVLYSRLAGEGGEEWPSYVRRQASAVRETGASVALRPQLCPAQRTACADMLALWRELTPETARRRNLKT